MGIRLILIGPPGSGKGTQATRICSQLGIAHISTGDILRGEISKQSVLGLEVERFLDVGELVPDKLILDIVAERLKQPDCSEGYLLDGFPRTVAQAQGLEEILQARAEVLTAVVNLVVDEKLLVTRILNRAKESGRADDTEEVISNRLKVFNKQTLPLVDFYAEQGSLINLDGNGQIEDITKAIIAELQ
jgi:adenylate kinase